MSILVSMNFGSLFAGIGGLDLGLERAGMECVWQVENDPYANKVLEKHWPDVRRYGDIKKVNWEEVERTTVICGGFPCPVVSQAARGRNTGEWLWSEFSNCIRHIRPRYVIVENVAGLLRSRLGDILRDLASIGYDAEWESLPASSVGAPHKRERVWIFAYPYGDSQPYNDINAKTRFLQKLNSPVWEWPNPPIGVRVDDGVSNRMDRLRCLGNAVVPQVAEWVGRRIMEHDRRS
jgi:DNA (cytosine-5)-methyltransferase 1